MEYTNKLLKGISHVFMCKYVARNVNYQIKKKDNGEKRSHL